MTLAFWQAGNLEAAARSVRDWARVDGERPAAHRFAARIYEDIGAVDLAEEAAERAAERGPTDAGAWERLGRLRLRLLDREGALQALRRATALGAGEDVRELIVQALAIEPRRRRLTSAPALARADGLRRGAARWTSCRSEDVDRARDDQPDRHQRDERLDAHDRSWPSASAASCRSARRRWRWSATRTGSR